MKNLVTLFLFTIILLFPKVIIAQSPIGISFTFLQTQISISQQINELIKKDTRSWGFTIHPEVLVHKKLNNHFDLLLGMGYLFGGEQLKVYRSVNGFITKINPTSTLPLTNLDIGKVYLNDIYLTLPIGINFYTGKGVNTRNRLVFSIKTELGLHLGSFTNADIAAITYDSFFGDIENPSYRRTEGTIYEPIVEKYFDSFTQNVLHNTQLSMGFITVKSYNYYISTSLAINVYHRNPRPLLLNKKISYGLIIQFGYWM